MARKKIKAPTTPSALAVARRLEHLLDEQPQRCPGRIERHAAGQRVQYRVVLAAVAEPIDNNTVVGSTTVNQGTVAISDETGLKQQHVFAVIQRTLDYIAEALAKGDKVELRNFGVFEVKVRKARVGRNPNAPAVDVPIPQRAVVKFKPGKEMRAEVIKLSPTTS